MSKEQLYSVNIHFKEGKDPITTVSETATNVEVIDNVLIIEQYYRHGKGKSIYNINTIRTCSIIPLSPRENESKWKEIERGEA